MKTLFLVVPAAVLTLVARSIQQGESTTDEPVLQDVREKLGELLEQSGISLDPALGTCAIPARVDVTNDLLEYLLVLPHGAVHESLLVTDVDAEILNAALLALGASPGVNATWAPKEPPPSEEELRAGASPYDIELPAGEGFYLYVAWKDGDELYFHRVEDLLRDLATRRTMQRHCWVYLGSRMVPRQRGGGERFAASAEGNLINIAFFAAGNTMLTAALEACVEQTIWLANPWLLPPFESPVLFVFARERLDSLPASLRERVPAIDAETQEEDGDR